MTHESVRQTAKSDFLKSIGARVYAGFGIVLVLLGGLGAVGIYELTTGASELRTFSRIAANSVHVAAIEGDFINLRRNALIYATSGDETAVARAKEIAAHLRQEVAQVMKNLVLVERKQALRAIGRAIDGYADNFERARKLRATQDKIVNEDMNIIGPEARKKLSEVIQSAMKDGDFEAAAHAGLAQEELLLVRLNAVRFLDKPEQAIIDRVREEFQDFKHAMTELLKHLENATRRKLAAEALELGDRYAKAFNEMTVAAFELHKMIVMTMSEQAEAIEQQIDAFMTNQRKTLAEIELESIEDAQRATLIMAFLSMNAMILGILAAFLIAGGIVRPVKQMTAAMLKLATGDIAIEIPARDRGDEVDAMAASVEVFKQSMIETKRMRAEQIEREARAAREQNATVRALANDFQTAVGAIVDTVFSASTQMEATAATLTKTAVTTQRLSTTVVTASGQVSSNVQVVAAATEELASSVAEVGFNVQEGAKIAREAVNRADKTNADIVKLSQSAQRIGDIVKLVTAVAAQTNLLALNATIEAARAGNAGKGFAVVAQEVKALASQTAKASEEISTQISAMQTATQVAVVAIKDISGTIGRVSEIATKIAASVEEQGSTTQEIARSIQQAAQGSMQVTDRITDVNHGAIDTGAASTQVLSAAQSLSRESNKLRVEVAKFLAAVRAA